MNNEYELLLDSLLEIIHWIKTGGKLPLIAEQIISYNRIILSLLEIIYLILLSGGIFTAFKGCVYGKYYGWRGSYVILFVVGLILSLTNTILVCYNTVMLVKVIFAPKLFILEKLAEILL